MRTINCLFIASMILLLSACNNKNGEYDASGVFETTEVIISAKGNGELIRFDVQEGATVEPNIQLGVIDTTQLYLKKIQLQASKGSIRNKQTNVTKQVASIQQQIATQRKEQIRFQNLVKSNAANQKQVDDIDAQILILEKQLSARTEVLENTNNSLTDESRALDIQIAQTEDLIKNSIINTPIKGTILAKYAEQGELAIQGKPLFKVADIETMYLRAYITAGQLTEIKINQPVKVYSDMGATDRREYPGTITWISDKAEFTPKTIQTRDQRDNLVYAIKIEVKNDGLIKKGMYGEISFQ